MSLLNWSFSSAMPSHSVVQLRKSSSIDSKGAKLFLRRKDTTGAGAASSSKSVCLRVGIDEIGEITHNKVLIVAALSSAIGQLSKPFTSAIFYGNNFNFKAAFQAGGLPSTHSSVAVATAMSLALERGFSDAIFGLAVVYAGLIMYDAQGVRREVGTHAKALNSLLLKTRLDSLPSGVADDLIDSSPGTASSNVASLDPLFLEEPGSFGPKPTNASLLLESDNRKSRSAPMSVSTSFATDVEGESKVVTHCQVPLKESVGHTEIEVIAGALLGLSVSLAVYKKSFLF
ncbi:unnamed protein product [Ilex paraguariensis]|uniref:Acid phosphatase/vanadium-dependent haloperoxidase-related protein n=1 Tax=Ilex paraguariensis TaxID=185542 RepID=A0ABC8TGW6_9AQUA